MKVVIVSTYGPKGFHFNGFYRGQKIKRILVSKKNQEFELGVTYLVLVNEDKIEGDELVVSVLAYKRLF